MPNDLTAKRNLFNWRPESHTESRPESRPEIRQTLAASGFTASVWTISGVVLVACGGGGIAQPIGAIGQIGKSLGNIAKPAGDAVNALALGGGGGGGSSGGGGGGNNALHVQKSPVQGARLYFDADDSGDITPAEMQAQDAQYPSGFITDATGQARNIPATLRGKPFIAILDGAIDADTGAPLNDDYASIPDANGYHPLASPITDFIAKQQGTAREVIARILPTPVTDEDIDAFLAQILDPNNYLEGGSGVEALADYLTRGTRTEAQVQSQIAAYLPTETPTDTLDILSHDTDTNTPLIELANVMISPHDAYVATIEAVNHSADNTQYSFVTPDGNGGYTPASGGAFTINARGIIAVSEGATPTDTTLYIAVSNGRETEYLRIEIAVANAVPSLEATSALSATITENTAGVAELITGISTSATAPTWMISGLVANKFDIVADGGTYNLVLKSGESLNYEATGGGVINLQIWAVESGVRSAPLELTINVEDANDAPIFIPATDANGLTDGTETIAENARVGTEIARVQAADADATGTNSIVLYDITSGDAEGHFSIDNSGVIRVASALDFETTPNYTLIITAMNEGAATMTDTISVRVAVTDIDDELPMITPAEPTGTIRTTDDSGALGVVADTGYRISVTDADTPTADLTFNVSDRRFAFIEQGGAWALVLRAGELVRLSEGTITLTYSVVDTAGNTADGGAVTLNVVDSPVRFPTPPTATELMADENDAGWALTLTATSEDTDGTSSDISSYAFIGDHSGFAIDNNGRISLISALDYEAATSHTLTIQATDSRNPPETGQTTITIRVRDVNDNPPAFTQPTYTAEIAETLAVGAEVARVAASDDDGTEANNAVRYDITDGDPDGVFAIDPDNGAITLRSALDFETITRYTLTITASDGGSPALMDTANVIITINDANDVVPAVDAPMGGTIRTTAGNADNMDTGYQITITDADTNNVFNVSVDDPRFILERDGATDTWDLVLLANQAVSAGTISLGYSVTDGANPVSGTFSVEAIDSSVSFAAGMGTRAVDVIENDASASVASVTATSTEAGTISYALTSATAADGSDASSLFNFDTATGAITLASALDYETSTQYRLVITATNEGDNNDAPAIITINVGDANDHAPVFSQPTYTPPAIDETLALGAEVARVSASDDDGTTANNQVRYSITDGDPDGVFDISSNGAITLVGALDFEATTSYRLTITATDGTNDTPATVNITINDINDESPSVPNHAPTGTARITAAADNPSGIGTGYIVSVSDADASNTIRVSANGDRRFDFVDRGGNVWELILLANREIALSELGDTISLTYTITDGGVGTLPVTNQFTLEVVDTPVEFTSSNSATLTENNAANANVIQVQATSTNSDDSDSPIVSYMFVVGNALETQHQGFTIDSTTGQISVDNPLDYDADSATREFTLRVRATDTPEDADDVAETNDQTITIRVGDANDNAPIFTPGQTTTATIDESRTAAEGSFLTITARDADGTAPNNAVRYDITGGTGMGMFFIDRISGAIRVADGAVLNYDTDPATTEYTLTITATDGGDTPPADAMTATEDVTITLIDINDESPSVPNHVTAGTARITAAVNNPSSGAGAGMGYSVIVSDADASNVIDVSVTDGDPRFDFVDRGNHVWELILIAGQEIAQSELGDIITLTYRVTDGGIGTLPVTNQFTLEVVETPVEFTSTNSAMVTENNAANANVIQVQASSTNEDDSDAPIASYMFVVGNTLETQHQGFTIDSTTGQISVDGVLDYDADNAVREFTLRVRATDTPENADDAAEINDQTITIRVVDANDNLPIFTETTYTAEIAENHAVGAEVARVEATDADGTAANNQVAYSITDGNVALLDEAGDPTGEMLFSIGSDGAITLNAQLNFEATRSYMLTIAATDGLDASGAADTTPDTTATVNIMLTDINDVSPSVPNHAAIGTARITALADNAAGTNMGYTITINDADTTNDFDVSVSGGNDRFEFVRQGTTNTWVLYLKAGEEIPQRELGRTIALTYHITDNGVGTAPVMNQFTLTVIDTPVRFASVPVADLDFSEDDTKKTLTISATSSDQQDDPVDITSYMFVYRDQQGQEQISATHPDGFSITNAGVISITDGASLDYEAASSHNLRVRATDANDEIGFLAITINVGNIDDETPSFTIISDNGVVMENMGGVDTGIVFSVADADTPISFSPTPSTTDIDPDSFTISVQPGINSVIATQFEVVRDGASNNWKLKLKEGQAVDYEIVANARIGLTITVTDGGGGVATQNIGVAVLDQRIERVPTLSPLKNNGQIVEDVAGAYVDADGDGLRFRITDLDTLIVPVATDANDDIDPDDIMITARNGTLARFADMFVAEYLPGTTGVWLLRLKEGVSLDFDDPDLPADKRIYLSVQVIGHNNNISGILNVIEIEVIEAAPPVLGAPSNNGVGTITENAIGAETGVSLTLDDPDSHIFSRLTVNPTDIDPDSIVITTRGDTHDDFIEKFALVRVGNTNEWQFRLRDGMSIDYDNPRLDRDKKLQFSVKVLDPSGSESAVQDIDINVVEDTIAPVLTDLNAGGSVLGGVKGADAGVAFEFSDGDTTFSASVTPSTTDIDPSDIDISTRDGTDAKFAELFTFVRDGATNIWRLRLLDEESVDYNDSDLDADKVIHLSVQVTDPEGNTASKNFDVEVLDASAAPRLVLSGVNPENADDVDTGITFTLTDPDTPISGIATTRKTDIDRNSFTITTRAGTDAKFADMFELVRVGNSDEWKLLLTEGIDYEDPALPAVSGGADKEIYLSVHVTDPDGNVSAAQDVVVAVENVDEIAPIIDRVIYMPQTRENVLGAYTGAVFVVSDEVTPGVTSDAGIHFNIYTDGAVGRQYSGLFEFVRSDDPTTPNHWFLKLKDDKSLDFEGYNLAGIRGTDSRLFLWVGARDAAGNQSRVWEADIFIIDEAEEAAPTLSTVRIREDGVLVGYSTTIRDGSVTENIAGAYTGRIFILTDGDTPISSTATARSDDIDPNSFILTAREGGPTRVFPPNDVRQYRIVDRPDTDQSLADMFEFVRDHDNPDIWSLKLKDGMSIDYDDPRLGEAHARLGNADEDRQKIIYLSVRVTDPDGNSSTTWDFGVAVRRAAAPVLEEPSNNGESNISANNLGAGTLITFALTDEDTHISLRGITARTDDIDPNSFDISVRDGTHTKFDDLFEVALDSISGPWRLKLKESSQIIATDPDLPSDNILHLTVRVVDPSGEASEAHDVDVTVVDAATLAPVLTRLDTANGSITENELGAETGVAFTLTDPDTAISFTATPDDETDIDPTSFRITTREGYEQRFANVFEVVWDAAANNWNLKLKIGATISYEDLHDDGILHLSVQLRDPAGYATEKYDIDINVADIDDPPILTRTGGYRFTENTFGEISNVHFTITDPDPDTAISYTHTPDDPTDIDPSSFKITSRFASATSPFVAAKFEIVADDGDGDGAYDRWVLKLKDDQVLDFERRNGLDINREVRLHISLVDADGNDLIAPHAVHVQINNDGLAAADEVQPVLFAYQVSGEIAQGIAGAVAISVAPGETLPVRFILTDSDTTISDSVTASGDDIDPNSFTIAARAGTHDSLASKFEIVRRPGTNEEWQLKLKEREALDYNDPNLGADKKIYLTAQVTDPDGNKSTALQLDVTVLSAPPSVAPTLTRTGGYGFTENTFGEVSNVHFTITDPDTAISYTHTPTDADIDPSSFLITPRFASATSPFVAAKFEIVADDGDSDGAFDRWVLKLKDDQVLDFERPSGLEPSKEVRLHISLVDADGNSLTAPHAVHVQLNNDGVAPADEAQPVLYAFQVSGEITEDIAGAIAVDATPFGVLPVRFTLTDGDTAISDSVTASTDDIDPNSFTIATRAGTHDSFASKFDIVRRLGTSNEWQLKLKESEVLDYDDPNLGADKKIYLTAQVTDPDGNKSTALQLDVTVLEAPEPPTELAPAQQQQADSHDDNPQTIDPATIPIFEL